MPGKSRRKGKYSVQSKKQVGQNRPAEVAAQPQVSNVPGTAPVSVSAPSVSTKAAPESPRTAPARPARAGLPSSRASSIRTEFVGIELRNIAILAAVMLVLLFVLARVIV